MNVLIPAEVAADAAHRRAQTLQRLNDEMTKALIAGLRKQGLR